MLGSDLVISELLHEFRPSYHRIAVERSLVSLTSEFNCTRLNQSAANSVHESRIELMMPPNEYLNNDFVFCTFIALNPEQN